MSRLAVISDIHGNLFAFQAVLRRLAKMDVNEVVCLGDIVGYGPHPGECLDLVVKYCTYVIQGNHDQAVVDPVCACAFNGAAREAIYWTRAVLGPLHLNALLKLPAVLQLGPESSVHCVHDSPCPGPTNYVHDRQIAALAFRGVETRVCLIGHTHVPMIFEAAEADPAREVGPADVTAFIPTDRDEFRLEPGRRYICNPGSVGQPRDCDPRASFAVLDLDDWTFAVHREAYDVAAAQAAAQQAGLPTVLADRLAIGA